MMNVTVFVGGTFDLFNVICKQHRGRALDLFLNKTNYGSTPKNTVHLLGYCHFVFLPLKFSTSVRFEY